MADKHARMTINIKKRRQRQAQTAGSVRFRFCTHEPTA